MNLYQINNEIMSCVDDETGEIIDIEKMEKLQLEHDKKIENIALWIKNLVSDANALKEEERVLTERRKKAESKAEQLRAYLDSVLCGKKFETPKVIAFYRKSSAVEISDDFIGFALKNNLDDYLTFKDPTANKTAIKAALNNGVDFSGKAVIQKRMTLNIK